MRKDRYIYDSKQDENYNKIAAFISHNTLRLLRDLMCAVRLNDINQVLYVALASTFSAKT